MPTTDKFDELRHELNALWTAKTFNEAAIARVTQAMWKALADSLDKPYPRFASDRSIVSEDAPN